MMVAECGLHDRTALATRHGGEHSTIHARIVEILDFVHHHSNQMRQLAK
ncbi:MAG: hypothetical protein JWM69_1481 [Candidatus Binatus sp.]|nr:hypothetical protein [Candidatus Binatus sp.]